MFNMPKEQFDLLITEYQEFLKAGVTGDTYFRQVVESLPGDMFHSKVFVFTHKLCEYFVTNYLEGANAN